LSKSCTVVSLSLPEKLLVEPVVHAKSRYCIYTFRFASILYPPLG